MILTATDKQGDTLLQETYYSVGGGFVLTAAELAADLAGDKTSNTTEVVTPYPFKSAAEMLQMAKTSGKSIAVMKRANELVSYRQWHVLSGGIHRIWQVMSDCIDRGMDQQGILPGGLNVKRRAKGLHEALMRRARHEPDPAAHHQ